MSMSGSTVVDPPLAGPTPVTFRQGYDRRPEVVAVVEDQRGQNTYVVTFEGAGPSATQTP
jgi:hypothetical protein